MHAYDVISDPFSGHFLVKVLLRKQPFKCRIFFFHLTHNYFIEALLLYSNTQPAEILKPFLKLFSFLDTGHIFSLDFIMFKWYLKLKSFNRHILFRYGGKRINSTKKWVLYCLLWNVMSFLYHFFFTWNRGGYKKCLLFIKTIRQKYKCHHW